MSLLPDKLHLQLKIYYILSIVICVIAFLLSVAYTQKYNVMQSNVMLERYGIIVTLLGIPLALKLFHSRINKLTKTNFQEYLKKYRFEYLIRLFLLNTICFFNIVSLYITGSKNFYFMVIVTIFAFFLCAPQKAYPENEQLEDDNEPNE